jgi:hypothetical protein
MRETGVQQVAASVCDRSSRVVVRVRTMRETDPKDTD